MKNRTVLSILAASLLLGMPGKGTAQQDTSALPQKIDVGIDTHRIAPPVSPYEYGMFIEHIGNTMYSSMWAEMLDDRKFYFPITTKEPAPPAQPRNPMRMMLWKWRPIGPDEVVTMDKDKPFVGEQSPRIALDAGTPHGIRQSGLALVKGRKYIGHIWLRATPGTKVKVALVWGTGANDRQTVSIPPAPPHTENIPLPSSPAWIPPTPRLRSPEPERVTFISARSRLCPPTISMASAPTQYAGNLGPLYGGEYDWTGGFLKDCRGNFDGISQHWYAQPGRHLSVEKEKSLPLDAPTDDAYVKVNQTLLQFARYPADIMHGQAEEWQGYEQTPNRNSISM